MGCTRVKNGFKSELHALAPVLVDFIFIKITSPVSSLIRANITRDQNRSCFLSG